MHSRARKASGGQMREFKQMAYEEILLDMMMELCICEKEAKGRLDKTIEEDPWYIDRKIKDMFGREYA